MEESFYEIRLVKNFLNIAVKHQDPYKKRKDKLGIIKFESWML